MFSVSVSSSRSTSRVSSSKTTFSRMVPNMRVVRWISGSFSGESRITFA